MRVQHPWRLTSGIVVAVLAAFIAYAGWLLWSAAHNLKAAADDASVIKAAALGDDPSRISSVLNDFANHARAAAAATNSPVWSMLTALPVLGDDARGVRTVSRVADDLSSNGLPELTGAVRDMDAVLPRGGGIDIARVQSLVKPVADSQAALADAREQLAQDDPSGYVGPLKVRYLDLQAKVDEAADAMGAADRALRVMPQMLGADGKRNYLLVVQNNAEIRATGGLPGEVSLMTAKHGHIAMVRQVAGNAFGEAPAPVLPLSSAEKQVFGENLGRYFLDANLTPDFARSSDLWKARWEQTQPEKVDGVVSVDAVALSYLLRAVGPVDVDGVHLTSDTVVDELLSKVYARLPDPADQDAFFRDVASAVFGKVTSFSGSKKDLLQALWQAAGERRILVHDFHADVQKEITGTAVAGELSPGGTASPQVGVYFADGTLSKMSYYLRYDAQVRATSCANGVQSYTGDLMLHSTAPSDAKTSLPPYVTGMALPKSQAGTQLVVVYVFAPQGGTSSAFGDKQIDVSQFKTDLNGRKVLETWVYLEPGQTKHLTWTMTSAPGQTGATNVSVTPSIVPGGSSSTVPTACS